MAMTTCPKCGRQVAEKIFVPLSQVGPGMKCLRCACGHEIVYKQPGYDEREKKRIEEDYKRRDEEFRRNHTIENYKFGALACILWLLAVCSSIYLLVIHVLNGAMGKGVLLFLGSVALLVKALCHVFDGLETVYPKDADEAYKCRNRARTAKNCAAGIIICITLSAFSILAGLQGGLFSAFPKLANLLGGLF